MDYSEADIKRLMSEKRSVTFSLEVRHYLWLSEYAKNNNMSISEVLNNLVNKFIESEGKNDK